MRNSHCSQKKKKRRACKEETKVSSSKVRVTEPEPEFRSKK